MTDQLGYDLVAPLASCASDPLKATDVIATDRDLDGGFGGLGVLHDLDVARVQRGKLGVEVAALWVKSCEIMNGSYAALTA